MVSKFKTLMSCLYLKRAKGSLYNAFYRLKIDKMDSIDSMESMDSMESISTINGNPNRITENSKDTLIIEYTNIEKCYVIVIKKNSSTAQVQVMLRQI